MLAREERAKQKSLTRTKRQPAADSGPRYYYEINSSSFESCLFLGRVCAEAVINICLNDPRQHCSAK